MDTTSSQLPVPHDAVSRAETPIADACPASAPAAVAPDDTVMLLLHQGVPISLLLDLTMPAPRSHEIFTEEGAPEDAWWER